MKTIAYLITPSAEAELLPASGSEVAERLKKRFLSEKVYRVYAAPGPGPEKLAAYVLGSRGFNIISQSDFESSDTPEKATQTLRAVMGVNLGRILVLFVSNEFINKVLEGYGSARRVTHDGSLTTVLLNWQNKIQVHEVDQLL
ncbi:MAG: hypothetical protein KKA90_04510 [Nanoarchaeota archaeon]|nr:hypothetical protein [Nanoarchaeota archaeon]